jgi:hypothetical protein
LRFAGHLAWPVKGGSMAAARVLVAGSISGFYREATPRPAPDT